MKAFITLLVSSIILFSCSNSSSKSQSESEEVVKTKAVNVYNYSKYGLPVLENVNDSKSRITNIQLGEKITSLGVRTTDSVKGREYVQIELSDGTTGWSLSEYIVENAYPVAVVEETPVYERPDITTKSSSKAYNEIDLAAVTEEKDNWYKVIGINNRNSGWIAKESVSTSTEDVSMTILAFKDIMDKEGKIKADKIEAFIADAPFANSKIIEILKATIEPEVADIADEPDAMVEQDSLN